MLFVQTAFESFGPVCTRGQAEVSFRQLLLFFALDRTELKLYSLQQAFDVTVLLHAPEISATWKTFWKSVPVIQSEPYCTMAEHHTAGSLVWVQDANQTWVKAVVERVAADKLEVKTSDGNIVACKPQDAPLQNPTSRMGVEVREFACICRPSNAGSHRPGHVT